MVSYKNTSLVKIAIITPSFIIVALILWNTYTFFQKFKHEERSKMEILAKAYENLNKADLNTDITLESLIAESNTNIPMIITDENSTINLFSNLDSLKSKKKNYLKKQLAIMKNQNMPIVVSYKGNNPQYIYYRDSDLLTKLKYYPLALLLILFLFAGIIYLLFKSNKIATQNKLWTGMAKETAHQIGTPLSSLMGWIEILKLENTVSEKYISEMEKDINRLNTITQRFSKIGSIPKLSKHNLVEVTKTTFTYLKHRSSKQISFYFHTQNKPITAFINLQLYSWVIENLLKNAIDAMEGKGKLELKIKELPKHIKITIKDSGKGITKSFQNKIFLPGFTTKKRGWGLGLSLAKRIIEDYHNGKIFVEKSEIGKGTSFAIVLKK